MSSVESGDIESTLYDSAEMGSAESWNMAFTLYEREKRLTRLKPFVFKGLKRVSSTRFVL